MTGLANTDIAVLEKRESVNKQNRGNKHAISQEIYNKNNWTVNYIKMLCLQSLRYKLYEYDLSYAVRLVLFLVNGKRR